MIISGQFGFNCPSGFREEANVHWMVLYNLKVVCSDMKFKMAATAGLSLTEFSIGIKKQKLCREPSNDHSWAVWFQLSKWFQRRSVLKHFFHRVQC
jgi:hypothetical protein